MNRIFFLLLSLAGCAMGMQNNGETMEQFQRRSDLAVLEVYQQAYPDLMVIIEYVDSSGNLKRDANKNLIPTDTIVIGMPTVQETLFYAKVWQRVHLYGGQNQ